MSLTSSTSSFLKLSPHEVVLDEWEVLDDPARFQVADGVRLGLLLLVIYFLPQWMMRLAGSGFPWILDWLLFLIPNGIVAWQVATRPQRKGYLCLTNWRCLYLQRGEGWMRSSMEVHATNLEDIVGVHCSYTENMLASQAIQLLVITRHEDSLRLQIGDQGRFLGKIPGLGRILQRKCLGRDALQIPSMLFNRIQERRTATVAPAPSY